MSKQMKITEIRTVKCNTKNGEKDKYLVKVEGAQKQASSFVGEWNKNWKVGDTISAEVQINGEYVNFNCPPELKSQRGAGVNLNPILDAIASLTAKIDRIEAILENISNTPTEEIEEHTEEYNEEVPLPQEENGTALSELSF